MFTGKKVNKTKKKDEKKSLIKKIFRIIIVYKNIDYGSSHNYL